MPATTPSLFGTEHLRRLYHEDLDHLERVRQEDRKRRQDWETALNLRFEETRRSFTLPKGPSTLERLTKGLARGLAAILF
jgi:hypothetical protein